MYKQSSTRPSDATDTNERSFWNSDPFFVSSSFDSTVIQICSCCVHFQQSSEMNDSVCTQCPGAGAGGIGSHCPPSSIGSDPSRLLPGTRVLLMSRFFTRPVPRLVIMPRAAPEPLMHMQRKWATDFCEELLQLDTASCHSSCCLQLCYAGG